ncbi:MAG: type II 3-dehydroquinate dehydratase [Gammaproteobacteria bacterium]|nr:type II 3-dehydroquinate dehydratase [Gammaproteobacteria bacterium]
MRFLLLNGPNLNLLGTREPSIYGSETLEEIENHTQALLGKAGITLECFQSNAEHELINKIHQAKQDSVDYILFNPAAYTHTSIALRDALIAVEIPFTEIHLSDPKSREEFRHRSFFSDIAVEVVSGLGANSYYTAVEHAVKTIKEQNT